MKQLHPVPSHTGTVETVSHDLPDQPVIKCYRVTSMHEDGQERSGLYDATSADEAATIVERQAAGVEDLTVVSVECID